MDFKEIRYELHIAQTRYTNLTKDIVIHRHILCWRHSFRYLLNPRLAGRDVNPRLTGFLSITQLTGGGAI